MFMVIQEVLRYLIIDVHGDPGGVTLFDYSCSWRSRRCYVILLQMFMEIQEVLRYLIIDVHGDPGGVTLFDYRCSWRSRRCYVI